MSSMGNISLRLLFPSCSLQALSVHRLLAVRQQKHAVVIRLSIKRLIRKFLRDGLIENSMVPEVSALLGKDHSSPITMLLLLAYTCCSVITAGDGRDYP